MSIWRTHPTLKFQCGICDEMYKTYNAAYRHTQTHFQLHYKCDHCDHRSQYPGGITSHMRTHTKTELIPCTSRGCHRKFTSKKAMWQHLQSHSPDTWKCDQCSKVFDTKSNFRQHMRGIHGTGWRALCGHLCQWLYIHSKHQKECPKCQAIIEERANKPVNPRKFTWHNLAKLKDTAKTEQDTPKNEQWQASSYWYLNLVLASSRYVLYCTWYFCFMHGDAAPTFYST